MTNSVFISSLTLFGKLGTSGETLMYLGSMIFKICKPNGEMLFWWLIRTQDDNIYANSITPL